MGDRPGAVFTHAGAKHRQGKDSRTQGDDQRSAHSGTAPVRHVGPEDTDKTGHEHPGRAEIEGRKQWCGPIDGLDADEVGEVAQTHELQVHGRLQVPVGEGHQEGEDDGQQGEAEEPEEIGGQEAEDGQSLSAARLLRHRLAHCVTPSSGLLVLAPPVLGIGPSGPLLIEPLQVGLPLQVHSDGPVDLGGEIPEGRVRRLNLVLHAIQSLP